MTTEGRLWILAAVAVVLALLHALGPILTPFIISALLAWLGDPVADKLEEWHFPRGLAVVTVFLATFVVLALLLLLIVPMVGRELTALSSRMPQFFEWYRTVALPWISAHLHVDTSRLKLDDLTALLGNNGDNTGQFVSNTVTTLTHSGRIAFAVALNCLLVPVITFYWLRDWDIFKARVAILLPRDRSTVIMVLARDCENVLAAFFRGQLLVMASLALIYSVGLTMVGLEGGIAIGIIAGIVSFVPYLGIATGLTLALLSAVLQENSGWLPLWVALVFAVGQGMGDLVLTPRLVGRRIGLHPVLVIFAILAGGELFGFVGVLLALPVAAAGTVFVRHAHARYVQSDIYRGDSGSGTGGPEGTDDA